MSSADDSDLLIAAFQLGAVLQLPHGTKITYRKITRIFTILIVGKTKKYSLLPDLYFQITKGWAIIDPQDITKIHLPDDADVQEILLQQSNFHGEIK